MIIIRGVEDAILNMRCNSQNRDIEQLLEIIDGLVAAVKFLENKIKNLEKK